MTLRERRYRAFSRRWAFRPYTAGPLLGGVAAAFAFRLVGMAGTPKTGE